MPNWPIFQCQDYHHLQNHFLTPRLKNLLPFPLLTQIIKQARKVSLAVDLVNCLATEPPPPDSIKLESDRYHLHCEGSLIRPPDK